ncbi:hypothetical protein FACS1894109_07570 [Spirochaetia bacterium]|nr:hypothetical protein FACS1894109_07570 [Spirochaetia bacterium]
MERKQEQNKYKEQYQQQDEQKYSDIVRVCKHCGDPLEDEDIFCQKCGEKYGGEERECPWCGYHTTTEVCSHCGKRIIPIKCPKCGAECLYDICEVCGTILNPNLEILLTEKEHKPEVMSREEIQAIKAKCENQTESEEFKKFQKKLLDHQIELEEREYFNKREKDIKIIFGNQPFEFELPDMEEEKFRMKAYAALEKTVIERQEKLLQDEWEKLFPEEKKVSVEVDGIIVIKTQSEIDKIKREKEYKIEMERKRAEMKKRYDYLLKQVVKEVEEFQEEQRREEERRRREEIERKRREEEERLRREEEERKRKEEEARKERERQKELERQRLEQENRLLGTYYWGNPGKDYQYLIVHITNKTTADCQHHCDSHSESYGKYKVVFDGTNITLSCKSLSFKDCPLLHSKMRTFTGTINLDGTVMTGYWDGESITHVKR